MFHNRYDVIIDSVLSCATLTSLLSNLKTFLTAKLHNVGQTEKLAFTSILSFHLVPCWIVI